MVRNKIDLDIDHPGAKGFAKAGLRSRETSFEISARRGDGVADLVSALVSFAQDYFGGEEGGLIARERQRKLLEQTASSLRRSIAAIGQGEELAAEDLRSAAYALGRLLGRVDVEDILDVIFREFCIGK
jgi:tRNA modification GTPase